MSPIREAAIKIIQEIPDDKLVYIVDFIKKYDRFYTDTRSPSEGKVAALQNLQQLRGRIPASLDYDDC